MKADDGNQYGNWLATLKGDERALMLCLNMETGLPQHLRWSPREVAERLGLNVNRACYILEKWDGKGWYDYGACIDMGWFTAQGLSIAQELEADARVAGCKPTRRIH